jgi:hypothetical protein
MKVKCKKDFVVCDKVVCRKGKTGDVEQFDASWFVDARPWVFPRDENPHHCYIDGHREYARGYIFKFGWIEVRLYDGKVAASHYRGIDFNDYFEVETMELTAENVEKIHNICRGKSENIGTFFVEGIMNGYWYKTDEIKTHVGDIKQMLSQLPKKFRKSSGGGWSFLNMCMRDDDVQWTGLHVTVEKLMCLGIACGAMEYLMPKELWEALPSGMPYVVIKDM